MMGQQISTEHQAGMTIEQLSQQIVQVQDVLRML